MHISLIINITGMKIAIHVAEIHWEGSVSQNFNIGLDFCFFLCRGLNFLKKYKESQMLPVFYSKMRTRTLINNLTHPSLIRMFSIHIEDLVSVGLIPNEISVFKK